MAAIERLSNLRMEPTRQWSRAVMSPSARLIRSARRASREHVIDSNVISLEVASPVDAEGLSELLEHYVGELFLGVWPAMYSSKLAYAFIFMALGASVC